MRDAAVGGHEAVGGDAGVGHKLYQQHVPVTHYLPAVAEREGEGDCYMELCALEMKDTWEWFTDNMQEARHNSTNICKFIKSLAIANGGWNTNSCTQTHFCSHNEFLA